MGNGNILLRDLLDHIPDLFHCIPDRSLTTPVRVTVYHIAEVVC